MGPQESFVAITDFSSLLDAGKNCENYRHILPQGKGRSPEALTENAMHKIPSETKKATENFYHHETLHNYKHIQK